MAHYGESRIRLLKVTRQPDHHDVRDLAVSIRLEGEFGGDTPLLPAGAIRNAVHALAKDDRSEHIEEFALRLAGYFLDGDPRLGRVTAEIAENPWMRIALGDKPHPWAFTHAGTEKRTTAVSVAGEEVSIRSGIANLTVLKTTELDRAGYRDDPFATADSCERILAAAVTAAWRYRGTEIAFGPCWHGVRRTMLETLAQHGGRSPHRTLYAMGEAVLESFDEIAEVRLSLSHTHCPLANLAAFGLENRNEVFVPADEPRGVLEAVLTRG